MYLVILRVFWWVQLKVGLLKRLIGLISFFFGFICQLRVIIFGGLLNLVGLVWCIGIGISGLLWEFFIQLLMRCGKVKGLRILLRVGRLFWVLMMVIGLFFLMYFLVILYSFLVLIIVIGLFLGIGCLGFGQIFLMMQWFFVFMRVRRLQSFFGVLRMIFLCLRMFQILKWKFMCIFGLMMRFVVLNGFVNILNIGRLKVLGFVLFMWNVIIGLFFLRVIFILVIFGFILWMLLLKVFLRRFWLVLQRLSFFVILVVFLKVFYVRLCMFGLLMFFLWVMMSCKLLLQVVM